MARNSNSNTIVIIINICFIFGIIVNDTIVNGFLISNDSLLRFDNHVGLFGALNGDGTSKISSSSCGITFVTKGTKKVTMTKQKMGMITDDNNNNDDGNNNQNSNQQQDLNSLLFNKLSSRFTGDFDNYNQVYNDRCSLGLLPREGGGHEHIHCTLVPLPPSYGLKKGKGEEAKVEIKEEMKEIENGSVRIGARLAAFYFNGVPGKIFRFRYYEFRAKIRTSATIDDVITTKSKAIVTMRLHTFHPKLEQSLRDRSEYPEEWPMIFNQFCKAKEEEEEEPLDDDNDIDNNDSMLKYLPGCDISWSFDIDPVEHTYNISSADRTSISNDDGIHAIMINGFAIVPSTFDPNVTIRILDQISLYDNTLYINDRGYLVNKKTLDNENVVDNDDNDDGSKKEEEVYVYGNQRGVPYRLERVAKWEHDNYNNDNDHQLHSGGRIITNKELQWTLGPNYRDENIYRKNMDLISIDTDVGQSS